MYKEIKLKMAFLSISIQIVNLEQIKKYSLKRLVVVEYKLQLTGHELPAPLH